MIAFKRVLAATVGASITFAVMLGGAVSGATAVTYAAETTFPETEPLAGFTTNQYLSVRGPDGWSTRAIDPRQVQRAGLIENTGLRAGEGTGMPNAWAPTEEGRRLTDSIRNTTNKETR